MFSVLSVQVIYQLAVGGYTILSGILVQSSTRNCCEFQGALHYNSLPSTIRGITSRSVFKKALLKYISSN